LTFPEAKASIFFLLKKRKEGRDKETKIPVDNEKSELLDTLFISPSGKH
jgi:hypothetical protein